MKIQTIARNADRSTKQIAQYLLTAITSLQYDSKVATLNNIKSFITDEFNVRQLTLARPLAVCLRRGVNCGFIEKRGKHYRVHLVGTALRPVATHAARHHKKRKSRKPNRVAKRAHPKRRRSKRKM